MKSRLRHFTNFYTGRAALISALIVSAYWIIAHSVDVYAKPFLGAVFEVLWAFMIPLLFLIPIFSLLRLVATDFKGVFFYVLSILLTIGTFVWMNFYL